MTMAILPQHLLEGEDFRPPTSSAIRSARAHISSQAGTSVSRSFLRKTRAILRGAANIDRIIFKSSPTTTRKPCGWSPANWTSLLDPKNAQRFQGKDGFACYDLKTSDYRGILFNFWNDYWAENKDIIPAVCYAIDRQAIVDAVLLGQGMPAYGPLQRNIYNNENVEHYDYNPEKAKSILESAGCTMGSNGYYERNGEEIGFVISVMAGEQDRIDIAQAAARQLRDVGIHCRRYPGQDGLGRTAGVPDRLGQPLLTRTTPPTRSSAPTRAQITPATQTKKVDEYLTRRGESPTRPSGRNNDLFQQELANDPAYAFICYIDANHLHPAACTASRPIPSPKATTAWASSGTSGNGRSTNAVPTQSAIH